MRGMRDAAAPEAFVIVTELWVSLQSLVSSFQQSSLCLKSEGWRAKPLPDDPDEKRRPWAASKVYQA